MAIPASFSAFPTLLTLNGSGSNTNVNRVRNSPTPPPSIRLLPQPTKIELKSIQPNKKKRRRKKKSSTTITDILHLMDSLQLPIQADMYASLLKECTTTRDALQGVEVHSHIHRSRVRPSIPLTNRLLLMYAACGQLNAARHLFDEMPTRNSISWASLIFGHAENNDHPQVLRLFLEMESIQEDSAVVQHVAFIAVCALKACIECDYLELGKQVHGRVWKTGLAEDMILGSSLVDLYGKFGYLESARRVFNQIPRCGSILWTSMIVGYCRKDHFDEAIQVFKEMGRAGKRKNSFTFSSVLRACGRIEDGGRNGRQVHAQAIKVGAESNAFVQSCLVDMYGKHGLLQEAARAFEMITERSMISWNAMLISYTRQGQCKEAIKLLYEMKAAGIEPPESMLNEVANSFL